MKAVIGLSGGMDSATLLGTLLEQGFQVHCCSFLYGSKHGDHESQAARHIVDYYSKKHGFEVHYNLFDLRQIYAILSSESNNPSNLMQGGKEIPEGHYNSENMRKTVVPGRNLIFASIMAGLAESVGAEVVALGVHSGDHHIYPDCRPQFVKALSQTIRASSDGKVGVLAPFTELDKAQILERGYSQQPKVPYHLTRTCYKDQVLACGKCGSCQERLEAFEKIGIKDPISYEE